MNNIYTPEFIKLASKIQAMIEPEVGMMVVTRYQRRAEIIVRTGKRYFDVLERDGSTLLGADRRESILLPSLSWLVRKLQEYGFAQINAFRDGAYKDPFPYLCVVEKRKWPRLELSEDEVVEKSITPELACLKALCKIKGIEVTE